MFHVNVYTANVFPNAVVWKSVPVLVPHQRSGAMVFRSRDLMGC